MFHFLVSCTFPKLVVRILPSLQTASRVGTGVLTVLAAFLAISQITPAAAQERSPAIEWVVIGHPRNPTMADGRGGVSQVYRISKYEITNWQYSIFLNRVARRDPHHLYDTKMQTEPCGGIDRLIEDGECHYKVRDGFGSLPVVYVSYLSAMRFANWMHNGHQSTETETGAYDLLKKETPRLPTAQYWIPTENEWIKAAYFDPMKGDHGGYWRYPSRTDDVPVALATSTILGTHLMPRHGLPSSADLVWYSQGTSVLLPGDPWTGTPSPLGTLHQGGNVAEWVDGFLDFGHEGRLQITHGGGWDSPTESLTSGKIELHPRSFVSATIGFRIASKALLQAPVAQSMR